MEHNRIVYTRPYDSEVEYLESLLNSTYIDTLLKPSNNIDCEILAQRASVAFATDAIFGGGIGYGSFYGVLPHKNTEIILLYGNDSEYIATNKCFAQPWVVKNVGRKFYINNTEYELSPSTEEWTFDYNIYLFAWNFSGRANCQTTGYIRIYYAKFWDNGVLVRDFIPVRVGNIGYMYDKVSNKLFANKGTGNFILGQDVPNSVPNIRRVFRFGNKRFVMPMPYDSKIEYLESTGTQWINTDTIVNSLDSISVTLQFTQPNIPACIFNARNTNPTKNTISLFKINNSLRFDYGKTQISQNATISNYSITHEYKSIANNLYVDDVLKATNTAASFTAGKSVMVLASRNVSTNLVSNFAYAKLYSVKIINSNNEVLRDFIPVRRGNLGYMYDRVSGRLFGNSGTGQFILGNDIND